MYIGYKRLKYIIDLYLLPIWNLKQKTHLTNEICLAKEVRKIHWENLEINLDILASFVMHCGQIMVSGFH